MKQGYSSPLRLLSSWLLLFAIACAGDRSASDASTSAGMLRTITDMRGEKIQVSTRIRRVVSIDDGFTAGVMHYLGEIDKIVGLGSSCVQRNFRYEYERINGGGYTYTNGMNPIRALHPWVADLPLVSVAASNMAINYETLAVLRPDVVVLRCGSCTLGCPETTETDQAIQRINGLGIPVLVLLGPPCYDAPTIDNIAEEIKLLGNLFGKEAAAKQLAAFLAEKTAFVRSRTKAAPETAKPKVLLLGLSSRARSSGGAGNTKGADTIESFFIETIANARNAYQGPGGRSAQLLLSAEQIFALDPDVIILPTASGYHPPEELYTAPYFQSLKQLRAVRNRRVYALPWTPCNCAKRIEYPLEMLIIAKAAWPERFADVKVHEWALDFYQKLYGVDVKTARQLRSAQWLDWTTEEDF